ncbi:hypothetical protein TeGR_g11314 [Tetraparma gracilis]|uniref:Uncharacterized protein n=1 Tax=Tetraparma gracilis TaxID=2962635 RepID=A0ABQ6N1B4_9STRA|nr:hypothetical protein TeGR_g11314 [Tetraparma gracilis]
MKFSCAAALIAAASLSGAAAQDPASGWMAYAVGDISSTGAERITRLEMTWTVGAEPKKSSAFFSPWFGMDPEDNLNLIQPVNPWSGGVLRGGSWSAYTEYYQWSPTHNSNSDSFTVKTGDTLKGSLVYDASSDSYTLTQTCVETGDTSTQVVAAQDGKKYTVPYVVYEKTFPCADYPPDEAVTFRDIVMECDGVDCVDDVAWTVDVKDDNCNMAASVSDDQRSISITWDTTLESKYDSFSRAQLHDLNMATGGNWVQQLNIERPAEPLTFPDMPTPVHPIKCAADVAKLAEDGAAIKTSVDTVTATCDKTHSDDCIASLNGILATVDSTLEHAETAFDDCSDGTDSQCNEDVSAILSVLADASSSLEADLADCVHLGMGDIKQCVTDVVGTGKIAFSAVSDVISAIKDCKTASTTNTQLGGIPVPVHPVACAQDMAKLAEQVGPVKDGIDGISAACAETRGAECVAALDTFLNAVTDTVDAATTALGDCSDGSDGECTEDVSHVLAALTEIAGDVEQDLNDCSDLKIGAYKTCIADLVHSGEAAVDVVEDVFEAVKGCI